MLSMIIIILICVIVDGGQLRGINTSLTTTQEGYIANDIDEHQTVAISDMDKVASNNRILVDNLPSNQWHRKLPYSSCLSDITNGVDPPDCPACHATGTCCMQTNFWIYGGSQNLGCTANSLSFKEVTGFEVFDNNINNCNCGGRKVCNCGDVPITADTDPTPCTSPLAPDEYDCEGSTLGTILDDIADGPACNIPLAEGEIDCEGKPLGTVFGACLGIDDVVEVSFTVNVEVTSAQSDVGLYINLNGGDAAFGDTSLGTSPLYSPGVNDVCTVAQLTQESPR